MKIARIEVTVPMLVYAAGILAALIVALVLWLSRSERRYEAYYRNTVLQAMNGIAPEAGLEACNSLIARYPAKVEAPLFRASLLYLQGQFPLAEEAFAGVTAMPTATPTQKAWAWVGRGAAAYAIGAKDKKERGKAANKAQIDFEEALKEDKNCADALVNLAVVQLWKGKESALDDAQEYCKRAVATGAPMSLEAQSQFYFVNGLINMRKNHADAATAFFERTAAILPAWKEGQTFRGIAILGAAVQPEIEPARRKVLLTSCEKNYLQLGSQVMVWNALGVGWALARKDKDEPEIEKLKDDKNALMFFQRAMSADQKDPRAYVNAAGYREDAITEMAAKLSVARTDIKGETPVPNPWLAVPGGPPPFAIPDRTAILEINRLVRELEDIWQRYTEKATAAPAEKVEAKLWLALCLRRRANAMEARNEVERANCLNKAQGLLQELKGLNPENPQVLFALGQVLFEKEDYAGAYANYKAAADKGMKTPYLERLLKGLDAKLELDDFRPPKNRRELGPNHLIGARLRGLGSAGVLKTAKIKIGAKALDPVLIGKEVLYLPGPDDKFEGESKVSVSVTDAAGQTVEFPPFAISLTTKRPSWSVEPEEGKELSAKEVVFKITLAAGPGIDFDTLKVKLKQAQKGGLTKILVTDGTSKPMPDLGPARKSKYKITNETFQVSAGEELTPGDWNLEVEVLDNNGNRLEDVKKYTVK